MRPVRHGLRALAALAAFQDRHGLAVDTTLGPRTRAAHLGFDRLLGYGLEYPTAFGDTRLGAIGRRRASRPAA